MPAPDEVCPDGWPLVTCHPDGACEHLDNLNDDAREAIIKSAVEYLWHWSGRRYGLCEVSVRPCEETCLGSWTATPLGMTASGPYPYLRNGNWYNTICGRCNTDRCGCDTLSTIVLPGPVDSIVEIWIDGEILPETAYRLDNLGLTRIDGGEWPRCQNMANSPYPESPGDYDDTFLVTYMRGNPVPASGQLALGVLACEKAKALCGDDSCRLPKRAVTVIREGVTIEMPNSSERFTTGALGIDEIDDFLAMSQHGNKTGFSVHSPDMKPYRRMWP